MNPALSVIVTIVDGGEVLRTFLTALAPQGNKGNLEILVPFDASVAGIPDLRRAFPEVVFLELGVVHTARDIRSPAGQHELFDRRRSAGLAAAKGNLIAILEDRGVPRPDWVQTVLRLHEQLPHAVIGGAIEPMPSGALNRAIYICDYSRYGLPFESGPVQWVSDVNISYKRRALELTRDLWKERFHEPKVHWELLRQGETLYLSSELVVEHGRGPQRIASLLLERFHWGRLFGVIRANEWSVSQRIAYTVTGPLIPFILLIRHTRVQLQKGHFGTCVPAIPAMALLLAAWTIGEVGGYITRKG